MQKCMFSSKSASLCSRLIFAPKEYSYLFFIRRKVSIITMIFQCFHQRLWYKLIDIFLKTITVGKSEYIKWKKKFTSLSFELSHQLSTSRLSQFYQFGNCTLHYFSNLLSPRCVDNILFKNLLSFISYHGKYKQRLYL